jgi:hypothetical protein
MILQRYYFGSVLMEDARCNTADVTKTLNYYTGTFNGQIDPVSGFPGSDEHTTTGGFMTAE